MLHRMVVEVHVVGRIELDRFAEFIAPAYELYRNIERT
jgi:hypothetical protein